MVQILCDIYQTSVQDKIQTMKNFSFIVTMIQHLKLCQIPKSVLNVHLKVGNFTMDYCITGIFYGIINKEFVILEILRVFNFTILTLLVFVFSQDLLISIPDKTPKHVT